MKARLLQHGLQIMLVEWRSRWRGERREKEMSALFPPLTESSLSSCWSALDVFSR